jgi:hypothetical protein
MRYKELFLFASIIAYIAVAGCGGGGGTKIVMPGTGTGTGTGGGFDLGTITTDDAVQSNGTLDNTTTSERFTFTLEGQADFLCYAYADGSSVDVSVTLMDTANSTIVQDTNSADGTNAYVFVQGLAAGDYVIEVAREGATTGAYLINVVTEGGSVQKNMGEFLAAGGSDSHAGDTTTSPTGYAAFPIALDVALTLDITVTAGFIPAIIVGNIKDASVYGQGASPLNLPAVPAGLYLITVVDPLTVGGAFTIDVTVSP